MSPNILKALAVAVFLLCLTPARADQSVALSSLDLSKATQGYGTPASSRSVDGHPLTLNGQTFAQGFGTHAPGRLIVALNGGTKRLTATVGVDDEVGGGRGSVEFEVLGDRRMLWRSGVMHQGQPAKTLDVDLTGVQTLTLRVTTGGAALDYGHADWADARFDVSGALPQTVAPMPGPDPVIWMGPPPAAPQVHPPAVVAARPGLPFLWTVPVSGARPLTFTVSGLPKGLALNGAMGTITGTVARPGDYTVRVRVKNAAGADQETVHLVVGPVLARTPPMGWNSYDCFGDDVTEAEVLANARVVAQDMQPYGWDTVVVDYRWYDPGASTAPNNANARNGADLTMDQFGRLLPAPNRFPSAADGRGFRALSDQVHALGLRFGIHIMRGIPRNSVKANLPIEGSPFHAAAAADTGDTCSWCPDMYGVRGDTPAGRAYYDSLFRLYAAWGVDFVKMDDTSRPYHTSEIEAVRTSIDKCGRAIVYSLSPGATPVSQAPHVAAHANMWRVQDDFWDNWDELDHEFDLAAAWHGAVGAGHWPDPDMLPVGHISVASRSVGRDRRTKFTRTEQVTMLSFWALLPAPLMVGADLPDNDPWTRALLTNPEVLAVDQDAAGAAAVRVSSQDGAEVWARPLADGSLAVGLFNRGDDEATVTARWSDLHLTGARRVRDLWRRKDRGLADTQFATPVPSHGAMLIRLARQ